MKKSVTLNSKVTIRCNDVVKTYQLVKSEDLDPTTTRISGMSPLGKLLLNSKVRDIIEVKTPSGIVEYKVVSIET